MKSCDLHIAMSYECVYVYRLCCPLASVCTSNIRVIRKTRRIPSRQTLITEPLDSVIPVVAFVVGKPTVVKWQPSAKTRAGLKVKHKYHT
jgi:hypothetical protein